MTYIYETMTSYYEVMTSMCEEMTSIYEAIASVYEAMASIYEAMASVYEAMASVYEEMAITREAMTCTSETMNHRPGECSKNCVTNQEYEMRLVANPETAHSSRQTRSRWHSNGNNFSPVHLIHFSFYLYQKPKLASDEELIFKA